MSATVAPRVRRFEAGDEAAIRRIMQASLAADRIPGFIAEDIDRALIRVRPDPAGTVVSEALDGKVVGYCTPRHDDLTVLPEHRRQGHGRALLEGGRAIARERGLAELQLYVPSHLPASQAFAHAVGMAYRSSLWQFELDAERTVPRPEFPEGLVLRAWDPAVDIDFDRWAAFATAAFEGHPTDMAWTPDLMRAVHADAGFDPTCLLIVAEASDPTAFVAFSRIELFGKDQPPGARTGEVGLIGVLPAWRGVGLGRALLRWGITELRARGAGRIELSVEAANERATTLYRAHGFEPAIEWPHWVVPV